MNDFQIKSWGPKNGKLQLKNFYCFLVNIYQKVKKQIYYKNQKDNTKQDKWRGMKEDKLSVMKEGDLRAMNDDNFSAMKGDILNTQWLRYGAGHIPPFEVPFIGMWHTKPVIILILTGSCLLV